MKTQPLISVIVPIYNIEDCLERCVDSILAQTYTNLEVLLVDDGSTDNTPALCDSLGQKDNRIRVLHKANGGYSSARNLVIKEATGAYYGFVDSDDFIEPDMYEQMMNLILEKGLQVAQISRDEIDENGEKRPDVCTPPADVRICTADIFLKELLLHQGDCSFCTKLLEARLFENRCFPEGELNEDFKLFVDMLSEVKQVGILPKQGYHVFYRVGSNTRKKDKNDFSRVFTDIVNNADFVQELVDKNYPDLQKYAIRFNLFQRLDYMLHIPVLQMASSNHFYGQVKKYLRKHILDTLTNPYLSKKNKIYLFLLTIAPKLVRSIHQKKMELRENEEA